jgi:hypothetical protein
MASTRMDRGFGRVIHWLLGRARGERRRDGCLRPLVGAQVATSVECLGDEVSYLELTQNAATVTGIRCEAFQKDCYTLQAVTLRSSS